MKYTLKLSISLPRKKVCALFNNPDNWGRWQESFVSYEPISGIPGRAGSKTKLLHKFGGKQTEMIETVESSTFPEEMVCIYEAPSAWNRVVYRFQEVSLEETVWELESEFKCSGSLKVMAFLIPGMFRKATKKDMDALKSSLNQMPNKNTPADGLPVLNLIVRLSINLAHGIRKNYGIISKTTVNSCKLPNGMGCVYKASNRFHCNMFYWCTFI